MTYLILIGLIIVVVLEYAAISIGKQADEEAERMYRRWKEEYEQRTGGADSDSDEEYDVRPKRMSD